MPLLLRLLLRHPRRTARIGRAAVRHRRAIALAVVAWSALSVLGGAAVMRAVTRRRRPPAPEAPAAGARPAAALPGAVGTGGP